jgi:nitrate reductase assembly molybdenum cofactor insertion protein NarJ
MTNKNINHYEKLAQLFQYPKTDYKEKVREAENVLSELYPETLKTFKQFSEFVSNSSHDEITEIFTRTFDVQAITTLDVGYVLFGDDYKRGELLVNLNREHREAANECTDELADNLANLLSLLPKMQNHDIRDELVEMIIMPGLIKIINEFDTKNINLKNKIYKKQYKTIIEQSEDYGRIFLIPLMVVYKIIENDFGYIKPTEENNKNNFTDAITSEIEID